MKVVIAGTRDLMHPPVEEAVERSGWGAQITEVVSGGSGNVDRAGEYWAYYRGYAVTRFPADWGKYGPAAGPIRNREMAAYADALIAVWDGESRGTKNMIEEMRVLGKPVVVVLKKADD